MKKCLLMLSMLFSVAFVSSNLAMDGQKDDERSDSFDKDRVLVFHAASRSPSKRASYKFVPSGYSLHDPNPLPEFIDGIDTPVAQKSITPGRTSRSTRVLVGNEQQKPRTPNGESVPTVAEVIAPATPSPVTDYRISSRIASAWYEARSINSSRTPEKNTAAKPEVSVSRYTAAIAAVPVTQPVHVTYHITIQQPATCGCIVQ